MFEDWTYRWAGGNKYIVEYEGRRQFDITLENDDTKLLHAIIDRMNGTIPPVKDWEEGIAPLEPSINNWDARMYHHIK